MGYLNQEILCKSCTNSENYWTEHNIVNGEKVSVCPHKVKELGLMSISDKLQKIKERRQQN